MLSEDTGVFDNPEAPRCPTWVALEDALLEADLVIGETIIVADPVPDEASVADAQHTTTVAAPTGEAIALRTHADGTIDLFPTTTARFGDVSLVESSINWCRLDEQLAIERNG